MPSTHVTLLNLRLQADADCAGVDIKKECMLPLQEYQKNVLLGENLVAAAQIRRAFHLDMRLKEREHPEHAKALRRLSERMEEEFDYLVEHRLEPFFRVRSYTIHRLRKEQQRVNWVNPAFMRSHLYPWHDDHGPRRPPHSKLIESKYYQWRWHTPEGQAALPIMREVRLY